MRRALLLASLALPLAACGATVHGGRAPVVAGAPAWTTAEFVRIPRGLGGACWVQVPPGFDPQRWLDVYAAMAAECAATGAARFPEEKGI